MASTFGQRLRQVRAAARFNQDVLGGRVGLSQADISNLENDKRAPTNREIKDLAEALGVTPWTLIGGTELETGFPSEPIVTLTSGDGVKWLGYFASALTSLSPEQHALVEGDATVAREACNTIRALLYLPAEHTHPERNKSLRPQAVYDTDHALVSRSDFVVLDARFPSFGAGQELEIATNACSPVVVLVPEEVQPLTRMVLGAYAEQEIVYFGSAEELRQKLEAALVSVVARITRAHRVERASVAVAASEDSFGARLRKLRGSMKVDHHTLATVVGLSPHALERFEKDEANPSLTTMRRIACALNTTVAYLADGVAPRLEDLDPVLRKGKDSLYAYAAKNSTPLADVTAVWNDHLEQVRAERRTLAEARTEPVSEEEWGRQLASRAGNGATKAKQEKLFDA